MFNIWANFPEDNRNQLSFSLVAMTVSNFLKSALFIANLSNSLTLLKTSAKGFCDFLTSFLKAEGSFQKESWKSCLRIH